MSQILPSLLSVAVAGTASSANLVAGSARTSIRIWQMVISGTAADTTVTIVWKAAGVTTNMKCAVGTAALILPYTGTPWAASDINNNITFVAAVTTTITAYYSQGAGG